MFLSTKTENWPSFQNVMKVRKLKCVKLLRNLSGIKGMGGFLVHFDDIKFLVNAEIKIPTW